MNKRYLEEILDKYKVSKENGLSNTEALKRIEKYGYNEIGGEKKISPLKIFIEQFKNIIVFLLLIAASIAFLIGDIIEGFAVLVVILLNSLFGFFTEFRAEKAVEALKEMISKKAKVIRDGELIEIEARKLVPGDILIIEEGDKITADGILLEADNLAVDEAVLTGESDAVNKNTTPLSKEETPLAEKNNIIFMGTAVTRGNGMAVITATGIDTEMGRISSLLDETEEEKTPIEKRLDKMGKSLIFLTLFIAAIIAFVGIIMGRPIVHMLETGVALAIAAVPEGLPAVATITLAIGMKKMANYNALIKSLPAVETLGSTTVICTDKTGTLTENQMTLKKIFLIDKIITVTGTGYKPEGKYILENKEIDLLNYKELQLLLEAALLCSNAVTVEDKGVWSVIGDPTEGALVTGAKKAGLYKEKLEKEGYERLDEIPFTSTQKYMAVFYKINNKKIIFLKGAPSIVLKLCKQIKIKDQVKKMDPHLLKDYENVNKSMAREGLRVLAIAYKELDEKDDKTFQENINNSLTFLGLTGIMDPPRADVKEAIIKAKNAGIRTIMITGDQSDTAKTIASRVGIIDEEQEVLNGADIKDLNLQDLTKLIKYHSVFARVSPEDKLLIVDALNENNQITAMTGDGVNDAPALKKADIGVAMGKRGTAVAREAADMILLDDNFSTIIQAVKYGRVIFDNIKKFIYYLFSCNLSEIMFIFFAIILQIPVPLITLQILWLNLVTDVFPAIVLAWETPEEEIMSRPPANPENAILSNGFKAKIALHAFLIVLGPFFVYLYSLKIGLSLDLSRTVGFMTLAFVQLLHVFNARRKKGSGFDKTVFENIYLWGAIVITISLQIIAVNFLPLMKILHTTTPGKSEWILILLGSVVPVFVIQSIKIIKYKYFKGIAS